MRIRVRVSPRARCTSVGGRYGDGEPPTLIVRVEAPAADGKANAAVVAALARAFALPRTAVRIVSGHAARTKVVELDGADPELLAELLARA